MALFDNQINKNRNDASASIDETHENYPIKGFSILVLLVGAFPKKSARLLQWVVFFQFKMAALT